MVRVLNTELPATKSVWVGLASVFGIGHSLGKHICSRLGFTHKMKVHELRPYQIAQIHRIVEEEQIPVGDTLRNIIKGNIDRLIQMRCYRGIRHQLKLPCRGQNTRSNTNTVKRARYY